MPSHAARLAVPAAIVLILAATASAANFTCNARGTCQSAIHYTVPNATTYGELVSRFNTTTLRGLLGANSLPASTPATATVPAKNTVRVPFRCLCAGNGVGQSDHLPVYTVQPQDGLDAIARNVFDAFVTYQEIATANNIPNVNLIDVGQKLWIPLPCSCDQVGGADVMHLAYTVGGGESSSGIAATYGVEEATLLKINNIADPKTLQKGQILDVPLPGKGCPAVPSCNRDLKLGQTIGAGCGSTTCAYSGYSNSSQLSIETTLVSNQTTACQNGGAARSDFAGSIWRMSAISFHMVLIFFCFL